MSMSRSRLISHTLRAGLLVVAGSALIAGPFLLGLDASSRRWACSPPLGSRHS
jgi:hypothetical protein